MKTVLNKLPEVCYALLPSEMMDKGFKRVSPIIIKRGESGYYMTDWHWDKENAQECCDKKNADMGVTKAQERAMMCGSMFGWDTPGADPEHYMNQEKAKA